MGFNIELETEYNSSNLARRREGCRIVQGLSWAVYGSAVLGHGMLLVQTISICSNDFGVNIVQVTSSRLCRICTNLRILSEISESLGTSKMRVKFQYLVHKNRKRSQRFCIHINEIYINFIKIKFSRNSHQCLNRLLQMDARLQIKLKISEYYAKFNKATIGRMAVSFKRRKISFPIKEKKKKKKKLKKYFLYC